MSKVDELTPIGSSYTGTAKLNSHLAKIEAAFQNTLSLDGSSPNSMQADLDMNSKRVINVLEPTGSNDVATKNYVDTLIGAVTGLVTPVAHTWAKLTDGSLTLTNYAALTALSAPSNKVTYITQGHTAANDGGYGEWMWVSGSTAATNGGTILALDSGGTGRFVRAYNDFISCRWFGVLPGNSAATNDTKLAAMRAWVATQSFYPKIVFPAGVYPYTTSPNWALERLRMHFDGEVTLQCSNSSGGNGFTIDSGATLASGYCNGVYITGSPKVEMLSTGGHAVFIRGVFRSFIAICVRSAGTGKAGFWTEFCVANDYSGSSVSQFYQNPQGWANSAQPFYGVVETRRAASSTESCGHNKWTTVMIEGVNTGVYLDYSIGAVFEAGTIEGCTTGAQFTVNAYAPRFLDVDFEANTSDFVDAGANSPIIDVFSGSQSIRRTNTLFPKNYIYNCYISNDSTDPTNDILFGGGECKDSTNAYDIRVHTQYIKRLDANWAAGTNQGGLDTGAIANSWYHCHVIYNPVTNVYDFLFSLSPTAPTLPTGYTKFRRVGSIFRTGGTIIGFTRVGDEYVWNSPRSDVTVGGPTNDVGELRTMSAPASIETQVHFNFGAVDITPAAETYILVTDTRTADTQPTAFLNTVKLAATGAAAPTAGNTQMVLWTNTSSQIRTRVRNSTADCTIGITTFGYIDRRY